MKIMRHAVVIALLCTCFPAFGDSHVFHGFDEYYVSLQGHLFSTALREGFSSAYYDERDGLEAGLDFKFKGGHLSLILGEGFFELNQKRYRYSGAITFPGETSAGFMLPTGMNVYVSERDNLMCMDGYVNGSGEYDRHAMIYLVTDPLGHQPKIFQLPGLLSSCKALIRLPGDRVAFPSNAYLTDREGLRVGLKASYFEIAGDAFVRLDKTAYLTFSDSGKGDVFRFVVQNH